MIMKYFQTEYENLVKLRLMVRVVGACWYALLFGDTMLIARHKGYVVGA